MGYRARTRAAEVHVDGEHAFVVARAGEWIVIRAGVGVRIRVGVRFVAATNRNLQHAAARGIFRQDLYFRLAGITLFVPPLRERSSEIAPLARTFAARAHPGRRAPDLSDEALAILQQYSWPGNVRELRNVIQRAVLLCEGRRITPGHLPLDRIGRTLFAPRPEAPQLMSPPPAVPLPAHLSLDGDVPDTTTDVVTNDEGESGTTSVRGWRRAALRDELAAIERKRIVEALEACGGNQTRAADKLGMSRRALIHRLEQFDLPRPRKGSR